jgi:hypothetical protein
MATGTRTTYTDANIRPESLNDLLRLIDWREAALLQLFGVDNQTGKFKFSNWPNRAYEWIEDTLSPQVTTMDDSGGISSGDLSVIVAAGTGVYFKEGDIVKIDDELVYVSSVSTDTLTIVRAFGGTTAASHSTGATMTKATIARLEGADYDTGHTTVVSRNINYTQILSEAVKVSGSDMVHEHYGIDDMMAYHIAKLIGGGSGIGTKGKAGSLAILLQKTFYYGYKAVGTASASRAMGGFEQFVTTNVTDLNGAALELSDIYDLMELAFLAGGMPDTIIVNTHQRRKISSFFEGSIRTERTEDTGGSVIKTIDTDFGSLEVVFDRFCPTDRLYLVEKDKVGWVSFRPFDVYDRASTGDYEVKEVLGEFGFVVCNQTAHGLIKEASTSL